MLARLARSGRFVVAVDTLPADLRRRPAPRLGRRWRTGCGGWTGRTMIGQLREHGVPVVGWAGAGSLDQVLRDVARLATAPAGGWPVRRGATDDRGSGRGTARYGGAPDRRRCRCWSRGRPCSWSSLAGLLVGCTRRSRSGRGRGSRCVLVAVLPARRPAAGSGRPSPRWSRSVGWLFATVGYDRPIALWRLLAVAALLYLGHTLCALAAVLPYDAVVDPDVWSLRWLTRAGGGGAGLRGARRAADRARGTRSADRFQAVDGGGSGWWRWV